MPRPSRQGRSGPLDRLARALATSAALGASAGVLEASTGILSGGFREPAAGARTVLVAAVAYGALALILSLPGLVASAWARRSGGPQPPEIAAPLAAGLVVLLYAGWAEVGLRLLPVLVVAAAWIATRAALPRAVRALAGPRPAAASAAFLLGAAALATAARASCSGAERLAAALVASLGGALALLALITAVLGPPRERRALRTAGALAVLPPIAALAFLSSRRPALPARVPPPPGAPNVVLVTFDTLRRDHVGCYGAESARTPAIDRLAAEGTLFLDASSHAPVTGPSHTSILTGLLPPQHGAIANGVHPDPRVATLADILADAGWQTGAFVSGFTLTDASSGLADRFDRYGDDLFAWRLLGGGATRLRLVRELVRHAEELGLADPERIDRPANEVVDEALTWLDGRDPLRPVFLWAHFFDAHAPYEPPPPFDRPPPGLEDVPPESWYALDTPARRELVGDERRVQRMVALYDGEIAFADSQLARLRAGLEERGLLEHAVVVVTADHGESLGEHDTWFDHVYLYQTELAVPLIVRLADGRGAGERVPEPVGQVDLAPTVLEACGLEVPSGLAGRSLVARIEGGQPDCERPVWAFGLLEGRFGGLDLDGRQASLRRGRWKLFRRSDRWLDSERVSADEHLFDLAADPGETRDATPDPAVASELRGALAAFMSHAAGARAERDLSDQELEDLRRLGYL